MRSVKVMMCVMLLLACVVQAEITTVWNPDANPDNDPNLGSALWTDAANWTGTIPEGGPDSNELGDVDFYKVVFNVADAKECVLDAKRTAGHLVMGDWGYGSVLRLVDGAELHAGCKEGTGGKVWTAVGWGGDATLIVEEGAYMTTYDHLWVCLPNNENNPYYGTVIIDGGTLLVQQMFGLNWDNQANSYATVEVKDGLLNLRGYNNAQSIRTNANLNIEKGTVIIQYWQLNQTATCDLAVCAGDGRVTGFKNANFDKTLNVEGGNENDAQNDIINNVKFTWDAANNQTILTAIHPQEPVPYLDDVVPYGNVTLEWNNWDPNQVGDSILVDIWLGTDPNKLSPAYATVVEDLDVTGQARSSYTVNVPAPGVYYWQVDTNNGGEHEGDLFSFVATDDLPPVVEAGDSYITWVGEPVQIDATVEDEGTPELVWTYEPMDGNLSFSGTDIEDPVVTASAAGTYTLTLTADDGFNDPVSDTMVITVYADACEAARVGTGANYASDVVVDCVINIDDFAALAQDWLTDYALVGPVVQ